NVKEFLRFLAGSVAVFILLSLVYFSATGAFSLLGYFSPDSPMLPINSIFHPRADFSNIFWRYFFAREWIPYYLKAGIATAIVFGYIFLSRPMRVEFRVTASQRLWLEALPLFVLSTVIFEARFSRYLIFVLPVFTVTLAFLLEEIWRLMWTPLWRICISVSSATFVLFILWQSVPNFLSMGAIGERITITNAV